MKLNTLSESEKQVILQKGTEAPFSGTYDNFDKPGIYACRQCNAYLYRSDDKFDSGCGWPSFDDEIIGSVRRQLDIDGSRTEILCARCGGHLGHVFSGEELTQKNIRHCVNSVSMQFISSEHVQTSAEIYLGAGCFWCTEAVFQMIPGVMSVLPGYTGGNTKNPTYDEVCSGTTGHVEVAQVIYNPTEISLERILEIFFDAHDPTTLNRQGNDVGRQYRSAIFVKDQNTLDIVNAFLDWKKPQFTKPIVTEISLLDVFYPAENYHHKYYESHKDAPYCDIIITPKVATIKKKYVD